jgi:hypothetical protein
MKRTLILSVLVIFTLGLFAPAIVNAMDNTVVIEKVSGDEKKTEKKADEKKATTETKACTGEKKAETKACCAEKKACTGEKKAECTGEKKVEKK